MVAGPPVDLSRWAGATPSRVVLEEMTDQIMLTLRDLLAEHPGRDTAAAVGTSRPSAYSRGDRMSEWIDRRDAGAAGA